MLLSLFKSRQPVSIIFIILFTLLLWINPFIESNITNIGIHNQMPLYTLLIKGFPIGSLASKTLGFLFLISIALLITRLNIKYNFIPERSYLPSIIFIITVLGINRIHDLQPFLPAALLFIFALDRLLETYKTDNLSYKPFDTSLILGVSALFYINAIYFIFFIWIALLVLRPFFWREWIYTFIGITIPFFLYLSINKLLGLATPDLSSNFLYFGFNKGQIQFNPIQIAFIIYNIILILIASQFLLRTFSSKKIFTRKSFNLLLVLFLISILQIFSIQNSAELIGFAAIPLSILFSNYFLTAKQNRTLNIIFTIYILSFIISQFINKIE